MPDPLLWALVPIVGFIGVAVVRYAGLAFALYVVEAMSRKLGVDELKADVAEIKAEVTLNHGSSLKDMVLATHKQVEALLTDGR